MTDGRSPTTSTRDAAGSEGAARPSANGDSPPRDRLRLVGEDGLLIEVAGGGDRVLRLSRWLRDQPQSADLREIVPAACTVFVVGPQPALQSLAASIPQAVLPDGPLGGGRLVEVPVRYDGADLAEVAERTGLTVADVVRDHVEAEYRVDFFGFAPGFAFLSGLSPRLQLPRRDIPRIRVPAGGVAIANEYTAIYPSESPGGWHLIGRRMGPSLWDSAADRPNRIDVGDRVVFREQR